MNRFLLITCVLVVAGLSALLAFHYRELKDARAKIAALTAELEAATTSPIEPGATLATDRAPHSSPTPREEQVVSPSIEEGPRESEPIPALAADPGRALAWRVSWQLNEIVDTIVLSEDERAQLERALSEKLRGVYEQSQQEDSVVIFDETALIAEALGPEIGDRYRNAIAEREARERAEALDARVVVLARRLSLTREQEPLVRSALEQAALASSPIREQIRLRMRDAMMRHSGAPEDRMGLQSRYDEIKALNEQAREVEQQAALDRLRTVLSDGQLNEFLRVRQVED